MGLFTKEIKSMDDLCRKPNQDTDIIEKATNRELTAPSKTPLEETEKQIGRLEHVAIAPTPKDCWA